MSRVVHGWDNITYLHFNSYSCFSTHENVKTNPTVTNEGVETYALKYPYRKHGALGYLEVHGPLQAGYYTCNPYYHIEGLYNPEPQTPLKTTHEPPSKVN